MKLFKSLLTISLTFLFLVPVNVFASDTRTSSSTDTKGTYTYLTSEEIRIAEEKALLQAQKSNPTTIQPYTDGWVEEWVYDRTATTTWSPFKASFGQQPEGHVYSNKGSGAYWSDSSRQEGAWSTSVSFAYKLVSVSIGYQPGVFSSSSGYFETCPDNLLRKKVKLFTRRQFRVNRYSVYRKNKYSGQKTFLRYDYISIPIASHSKIDVYNAH